MRPLARQLLQSYIAPLPYINCVAVCQDATEAFCCIAPRAGRCFVSRYTDAGINGLNFLKSLKAYPKLFLLTAYPNHAVEGF